MVTNLLVYASHPKALAGHVPLEKQSNGCRDSHAQAVLLGAGRLVGHNTPHRLSETLN